MREKLLKAFESLGKYIAKENTELLEVIDNAYHQNTWFSANETKHALRAWAKQLEIENTRSWLSHYPKTNSSPKKVGLILAGNIPMVGFHDVCSVLFSGNIAQIKLSSQDGVLIKHLIEKLIEFEPSIADQVIYEDRMNTIDAIIATGSNNSARHFEYYFGKIPNIIRRNRNSVAILTGNETAVDFVNLGEDIFRYYGQGCRNVSKVYVPIDYDFIPMLDALEVFNYVGDQHKYLNNYNYYKSIYLVNREHHLDNGFLLLRESDSMQAPLSVLYFEHYQNIAELNSKLDLVKDQIQCIVADSNVEIEVKLPFGQTQSPGWMDYADGVDTMKFLTEL